MYNYRVRVYFQNGPEKGNLEKTLFASTLSEARAIREQYRLHPDPCIDNPAIQKLDVYFDGSFAWLYCEG